MTDHAWHRHVLDGEGLSDWQVELSTAGGYCWMNQKLIQLNQHSDQPIAGFLHEVAHALHPEYEYICNVCKIGHHYHGGGWADTFGRLVNKYMTPKTHIVEQSERKDKL
jgi:hypothetical protein